MAEGKGNRGNSPLNLEHLCVQCACVYVSAFAQQAKLTRNCRISVVEEMKL